MSNGRIRRLAAPPVGYAQPKSTASAALSNHAFSPVPGSPPAPGATGNILSTPITFTPRVSGKVFISWCVSGIASGADVNNVFTLDVGVTAEQVISSSSGGDTAHTLAASGSIIVSGLAIGTPVTINVAWATGSGTWGPSNSQGGITVIELPG